MRCFIISAALLLMGFQTTIAQQARVRQYTAPLAGTAALRDADDKYNASVYNLEAPDVEHNADKKRLREIKQQVEKAYPRKASPSLHKKTSAVLKPTVTIGFIADTLSGIPPDNYCAVSNGDKAVAVMNSNIAVHNATTGAYLTRKALLPFSTAVGLPSSPSGTNYRFDPKVVYDPEADRFICVMLNGVNQYNYIVLAFSKTNDPTGEWNFYKFYGDFAGDTTWFDYPAIAITKNEFFLTGNQIKYNQSWQAGFKETLIYQFRKADGYNGSTVLSYQIWDSIRYNNRPLRCLYPLNPGDQITGPEQYFLSNRNFDMSNDSIFIVKVPDTIGSGNTAFTVTPVISNLPYGVPPNGQQPDTSKTLATNDGRVLGGFYRGDEMHFVSTSVNPANGASSVYHGIISNFKTAPTVFARLISIDSLDFGYPNVSFAGSAHGINHAIISYEFSGRSTFPGYGAVFFDGSEYSDMLVIKSGDNSIRLLSGKEQRWGDYSGSHTDWDAIGAVWTVGIFGRRDNRYGNYMARLASPFYTSSVPEAGTIHAQASKLFPDPAWEYVNFEFNVSKPQYFTFGVFDVSGKMVDQVLATYCKAGRNLIQFNVAPLAPGMYLLKAMGNEGEVIPVHKLIRQ
jgi:hypothetical protein